MRKTLTAALLCAAAFPLSAAAQESGADSSDQASDTETEDRLLSLDRIVVRAGGLERLDMLASTSVVDGIDLQRNSDGQIGEVLARLPGVSATSFSPGASRPVLRGFQGERVRVLTDGIGSIDASGTSADHAVAINPLLAESVEVLRGPAVLLFGSSAIGGAVNVIDRRTPTTKPTNGFRLDTLGSIDTAYDLREFGASADVTLGGDFVFHVDGSYRQTDDVEIPGFAVAGPFRAELLAEAAEEAEEGEFEEAEEFEEAANQSGVVPNTATETYTAGAGIGWITADANFGFSVGYYDTVYGIPGRPGAGHHHGEEGEGEAEEEEEGEENVTIDLEQFRADFRGQIHVSDDGFFHDIIARAGYSDYTHIEFEGAEVGTTFEVEGFEARLEAIQTEQSLGDDTKWRGSFGLQVSSTDFVAIGEEAFVPPNSTDDLALFVLQELEFGSFEIEGGARYEMRGVTNDLTGADRDFDTFSGALGFSFTAGRDVRLGVNLSRAERAPSAEELFADGPHIATQQFEIGDDTLGVESSWGVEPYLQASFGGTNLRIAAFRNWFDDFIFLAATGLEEDELPVFQHTQQDATYTGFEAELTTPIGDWAGGSFSGELGASYVDAELGDGTAVPRTPPLSATAALQWQSASFGLRGEVEAYASRNDVADFETDTEGFAFANFSANFRPFANDHITVLAQVRNVFDATGRRHASFTKDFLPLAGRNFRLTVRSRF